MPGDCVARFVTWHELLADDIHEHRVTAVEREVLPEMITRARQSGHHDLRSACRDELTGREPIAHDLRAIADVEKVAEDADAVGQWRPESPPAASELSK